MKPSKPSFFRGFSFAFDGIVDSVKSEVNLKVQLGAACLAIAMGLFFQISTNEWLWILLVIFLVLAAEVMNTAIESLSNLVSSEYHPLIKKAKDAAAGAVLLISILALICGAIVFLPKIILCFF